MLVQLGQHNGSGDVVDLLFDCHGRIRRFLELAARLATAREVAGEMVEDTAGQIRRYFAEAFPLHLADEDELIVPKLIGRSAHLDAALARMYADHVEHEPLVAALMDVCARIQREPGQVAACAAELTSAATALRMKLEPHLDLEEQKVFPAISALETADRDLIKAAMRHRHGAVLSASAQTLRR